jgi:hypothetical protein
MMEPVMRRRHEQARRDPRLDYHDPTAGLGGAPPAASALTLRAWLAGIALLACVGGIIATVVVDGPVALIVVLAIVAATTIADLMIIRGRRAQAAARSPDRPD